MKRKIGSILAGAAAGIVNGLFGAGGGMVLIPLLERTEDFSNQELFSSSIAIILPICVVSLMASTGKAIPWSDAWPFLLGAVPGGILAGLLGKRIPTLWLHRALGILILYGGVRYLC